MPPLSERLGAPSQAVPLNERLGGAAATTPLADRLGVATEDKGAFGKALDYLKGEETIVNKRKPAPVKPSNAVDVPSDWHQAIADAQDRYPEVPKGVVPAVMMMESSMGKVATNKEADLGDYGYLGGITKTGHFPEILKAMKANPEGDYKIRGIDGIEDIKTPYAAIQAIGSTLAMLHRNHPDADPVDLYFKLYNAAPQSDTPARRDLLKQLIPYYAQSTGTEIAAAAAAK